MCSFTATHNVEIEKASRVNVKISAILCLPLISFVYYQPSISRCENKCTFNCYCIIRINLLHFAFPFLIVSFTTETFLIVYL